VKSVFIAGHGGGVTALPDERKREGKRQRKRTTTRVDGVTVRDIYFRRRTTAYLAEMAFSRPDVPGKQ